MDDQDKLAQAMTIAEVAVQEMAEAGIEPMQRAIGLAFHMQEQAELAMPNAEAAAAAAFKLSLAT